MSAQHVTCLCQDFEDLEVVLHLHILLLKGAQGMALFQQLLLAFLQRLDRFLGLLARGEGAVGMHTVLHPLEPAW